MEYEEYRSLISMMAHVAVARRHRSGMTLFRYLYSWLDVKDRFRYSETNNTVKRRLAKFIKATFSMLTEAKPITLDRKRTARRLRHTFVDAATGNNAGDKPMLGGITFDADGTARALT